MPRNSEHYPANIRVVVTWHDLDSSRNPQFPQAAMNVWKGNVSWRTATAYDATQALIAA